MQWEMEHTDNDGMTRAMSRNRERGLGTTRSPLGGQGTSLESHTSLLQGKRRGRKGGFPDTGRHGGV